MIDQAPIAKLRVLNIGNTTTVGAQLYSPGLPDGEHDVYCEPPSQWQPIETVPKDGNAFLCDWWSPNKDYWWVCKAHWANGCVDGGWDGAREPWEVKPTHWMPLPAPPSDTSTVSQEKP